MSTEPQWYKTAVFYEVYLRAFKDSNGDGHGDFRGLLEKVDHLKDLGVDCVWICPFYPSPLFDDGYDVADYYNIHPDYGTLEDFKAVVDALHSRGIRVIADLVMNHTSDQHPWFIESRSSLDNPKRDWYVWSNSDQIYTDARIIFLDTEPSNWTLDPTTGQYFWHRFYAQQPDLNFDNPEVQAEMLRVVDFWLGMGLDGFRADAVPYLFEREGTNCENLPETHQFLKKVRAHMDQHHPGTIILCEANQWPEDVREYFGNDDECHMGFHFPVMPRLYMALKQQNRQSIVNIMQRTPPIPPNCQWCVFLRNHDELTLEMVTPQERDYMWDEYASEPRMRLNLGIRRRLAPLVDNDQRRIELLNALVFTLPGSPIIYYGDEIGMGDNISLRDRDGVRTPMQWSATYQAGFSSAEKTYSPVIDDETFGYQQVNVDAKQRDPHSIFNRMKHMMAVRKQHLSTLGLGTFEFALVENLKVLAYWRRYEGEAILVVANLSDEAQAAEFSFEDYQGVQPLDLLSGEPEHPISAGNYVLSLPPYGYRWLKLR